MKKLKNKVVVITGGNSGIGLAIAHLCQQEGASVTIFGRNKDTLDSALSELNNNTLALQGDVQNIADIENLFLKTQSKFGMIDCLIVNAGEGKERHINDVDECFFDTVSNINFKGAYFTAHKGIKYLKKGGSIILMSSAANKKGLAGLTIYSAAKAAVRSLARGLAVELAPRGIRVNSISPGGTDTPFLQRDGFSKQVLDESIEAYNSVTPLNRMGSPDEIAAVALFLASQDASYINGSDIAVDGGYAQI
jgi:NAD(P)-dependent dehydrogenase (short-subunit alcohol dehydrogenase family)